MAEAQTLNCPMCGAAASSDSTLCEHCGARLATVACPSCFGLVFVGSKFCSHCGARMDVGKSETASTEKCPRCRVAMDRVVIGGTPLEECPKCEGIWADPTSLQQICRDREKQAAVLGMAVQLPVDSSGIETVRYIPCPVCGKLMNRINFAHCSHVVVDVCSAHGTWFDRDELRRIVEFIRAGGLDSARAKEIAELEQRRREMRSAQMGGSLDMPTRSYGRDYTDWGVAIGSAAEFLRLLFSRHR